MKSTKTEFFVRHDPVRYPMNPHDMEVYVYESPLPSSAHRVPIIWEPVVMRVLTEDETRQGVARQPCFVIDREAAQTLMDGLWNAGVRPTEGAGSAGAMAAVQKHLDDMRKITFHKLGVPV